MWFSFGAILVKDESEKIFRDMDLKADFALYHENFRSPFLWLILRKSAPEFCLNSTISKAETIGHEPLQHHVR
jgi:hypothetical protein